MTVLGGADQHAVFVVESYLLTSSDYHLSLGRNERLGPPVRPLGSVHYPHRDLVGIADSEVVAADVLYREILDHDVRVGRMSGGPEFRSTMLENATRRSTHGVPGGGVLEDDCRPCMCASRPASRKRGASSDRVRVRREEVAVAITPHQVLRTHVKRGLERHYQSSGRENAREVACSGFAEQVSGGRDELCIPKCDGDIPEPGLHCGVRR